MAGGRADPGADSCTNGPIAIVPTGSDDTPVETGNHLNQRDAARPAKRVGTIEQGEFDMSEQAVLVGG